MARNDVNIVNEKVALARGQLDSSIPVMPVLEVGFAVPVPISPAALRPAPITTFPDFFGKLVRIVYDARNVFEEQFPRDTRVAGDAAAGNEFATYVETSLPEARNTLLETIRQRAGTREWTLEPWIVEIAQEQVASIPSILRDAIATQAQAANDRRKFTVTQYASAAAAAAVGKVHKYVMPTEVFGTNVFEFQNATAAPFRVKYVVAAKTYNVTISCSKVNVVYWDGVSRREVGHEEMAGFLGMIFQDEVPPEASPVLGAFRQAAAASQSWEPVTYPVTLYKPIAVPEGFLERYLPEFPMGRVNDP